MFKLQPEPTFKRKVTGFVPGRPLDGLTVTYRYKNADELRAWHASMADVTLRDALAAIIDTWDDAPMPYTPDALDEVAKLYPAFLHALIETYRREIFDARLGN